MLDFSHKTVIIAGGCGLIGRALVKGFEDYGAEVIVADVADNPAADVCDSDYMRQLCDLVPDVWVNAVYPRNYRDHLDAFLYSTRIMAENMAERGGGVIVLFASIYGVVSYDPRSYEGTKMYQPIGWADDYSPYHGDCAVKAAIIQLSRVMAVEFAPKGVRINCLGPGGVFDNQPGCFVKKYCERVPMNRMARPEDLVGPVLFLTSDMSQYVTGQNLVVDGGLTLW